MDHVLVFMAAVTKSNILQIIYPSAILRFPPISCPLMMMMSGGLIFSQIPVPLSQICQQNIHRLTDDSRSPEFWFKRSTRINFFLFLRQAAPPGWKNFSWNICLISRIVIFMSFIIVVSPNRHFRQCPSYKSQNQRNLKEPPASDFVVSSSANLFPANFLVRAT